jgi:hypothetical protein
MTTNSLGSLYELMAELDVASSLNLSHKLVMWQDSWFRKDESIEIVFQTPK